MAFTLPDLPYSYDALEPAIDSETMHLHHDKHHAGYVKKLNEALKDYPKLLDYNIDTLIRNIPKLPKAIQTDVLNQGGGHYGHCIFWLIMSPDGSGKPMGKISEQINKDFGSFDKFKKKFIDACMKQFGSGWGWLIFVKDKLEIVTTGNHINPLTKGHFPIFNIDCWEHALAYQRQNRKEEYYNAIWNVFNWDEINIRFSKAKIYSDRLKDKTLTQKQFGV